ncbi:hypothetical protein QTI24_18785 [Variovorax sp. J22P240]|uniref:hypothetical protein n=1 Tax=unclassified Variovorax TaxID=663243 RepID=UPI002574C7E2|nr:MULTISPECIES: hypothetical protein [unclassified Variovorax]MDM0000670.1 hypothetical protein [Variovorax sp. J22P240]MDM0053961.1 hypothetical protein [Variovorax sp. J22R115]
MSTRESRTIARSRKAAAGAAIGIALCAVAVGCTGRDDRYTLYRDSVVDPTRRVHVATFDAADGDANNRDNCEAARAVFQAHPGIRTKFWCEKGPFKKTATRR